MVKLKEGAGGEGLAEKEKASYDKGFEDGAEAMVYTTWLHCPNKKVPLFTFDIYGEAGSFCPNKFSADEVSVQEREETQKAYEEAPEEETPVA